MTNNDKALADLARQTEHLVESVPGFAEQLDHALTTGELPSISDESQVEAARQRGYDRGMHACLSMDLPGTKEQHAAAVAAHLYPDDSDLAAEVVQCYLAGWNDAVPGGAA